MCVCACTISTKFTLACSPPLQLWCSICYPPTTSKQWKAAVHPAVGSHCETQFTSGTDESPVDLRLIIVWTPEVMGEREGGTGVV